MVSASVKRPEDRGSDGKVEKASCIARGWDANAAIAYEEHGSEVKDFD